MSTLSIRARLFIGLVIAAGLLAILGAGSELLTSDLPRFLCYLGLAALSGGLKVPLPGVTGTMSVNFLFLLVGVVELNLPETLLLGVTGTLAQMFWKAKQRPTLVQVAFNLGAVLLAVSVAFVAYHSPLTRMLGDSLSIKLIAAVTVFFVTSSFPVACMIALTEGRSARRVWKECYLWSFPYHLVGAALVCAVSSMNRSIGWQFSLLLLPVCYVLYRSYLLYMERLEAQKLHVEQMNGLHLRTIEALALAIEAKDNTTSEHLQRVQHYAMSLGKLLNLSDLELEALRAASVLHDIGKLAVPEHIISKPGKLTPQEFEKMKIHPIVGAEILERVDFPYPVAPIVRAHHEKWNGHGYPYGLAGEEIPIGARILAAVDCLDALAADRQYRRALPLNEAMKVVESESGKSYDPKIVELLSKHYVRLEAEARALHQSKTKLSKVLKVERGVAPATGFESSGPGNYVAKIAAAGQESRFVLSLVRELGNSLRLDETLSRVARTLGETIAFDAIAVYECRGEYLVPAYVEGQDKVLFSSLEIPIGEGLSGWVAKHNKAILNGNPSVEPGYLNDASKFSTLRSAIAVPLEGMNGVVGVLTLYHMAWDAFGFDDQRILTGVSSKIGLSIEHILKYRELENFATTDHLTGLLNTRLLFQRLEQESSRCQREGTSLTVMLCDLNGFKQANDRFGHTAGNRVLQLFAQGLTDLHRDYDIVARLGGDEFVIAVVGLDDEVIRKKVDAITRLAINVGKQVTGEAVISVSVGHATYSGVGHPDPNVLLAEADRLMYEAKKRNQASRAAPELEAVAR